jgi:hypothetical protein
MRKVHIIVSFLSLEERTSDFPHYYDVGHKVAIFTLYYIEVISLYS